MKHHNFSGLRHSNTYVHTLKDGSSIKTAVHVTAILETLTSGQPL